MGFIYYFNIGVSCVLGSVRLAQHRHVILQQGPCEMQRGHASIQFHLVTKRNKEPEQGEARKSPIRRTNGGKPGKQPATRTLETQELEMGCNH